MAMVYCKDVLFVHVPKAGGTSATQFLLESLPRPLTQVAEAELRIGNQDGIAHIHGDAHLTLPEARAFLAGRGISIADFPMILAVIRNPYDLFVSQYHYLGRRLIDVERLDQRQAPPAPSPSMHLVDVAHTLQSLTAGSVARIEPTRNEALDQLQDDVSTVAIQIGLPVESWTAGGALYVSPNPRPLPRYEPGRLARELDFKQFARAFQPLAPTFLHRLYDYFHLDGTTPPNLRIIRFENLAQDMNAALRETGLPEGGAFPWVNRTEHAPYASHYDAESEAVVYEQVPWLFDEGYYERLPVASGSDSRQLQTALPRQRTPPGEQQIDSADDPVSRNAASAAAHGAGSAGTGNEMRVAPPRYTLIDEAQAPARPAFKRRRRLSRDLEALVAALTPGRVAQFEPTDQIKPAALRRELFDTAARLGRPVDVWEAEGVLYAGLATEAARGVAPSEPLAALVAQRNAAGPSYHRIDLGDGVVLEGTYDLVPYLPHYGLPARLDRLNVLDVGTASGFWALELARRGANVTAIDLWPPAWIEALAAGTGLPIRYVQRDLYTLDEAFGEFDLVMCGTVLLHLPDLLGALRAMRRVCRGQLIVATGATPDSATTTRPVCNFEGARAEGGAFWAYWSVSAEALRRMLVAADFAAVERVEHFMLTSIRGEHVVPHVVMTATV